MSNGSQYSSGTKEEIPYATTSEESRLTTSSVNTGGESIKSVCSSDTILSQESGTRDLYFGISELDPKITWENVSGDFKEGAPIYIDGTDNMEHICGTTWRGVKDGLNVSGAGFENIASALFKQRGWSGNTTIGGHIIEVPVASGWHSDSWGYVKIQENKVRVIFINESVGPYNNDADGVMTLTCPCRKEFVVTISDIVPIDLLAR